MLIIPGQATNSNLSVDRCQTMKNILPDLQILPKFSFKNMLRECLLKVLIQEDDYFSTPTITTYFKNFKPGENFS